MTAREIMTERLERRERERKAAGTMHYGELFVPKTLNDGTKVADSYVANVAMDLCNTFGGLTLTDARGFWRGLEGRVYDEPMHIFRIDSAAGNLREKLLALAAEVRKDLDQESVYVRMGKVDVVLVAD